MIPETKHTISLVNLHGNCVVLTCNHIPSYTCKHPKIPAAYQLKARKRTPKTNKQVKQVSSNEISPQTHELMLLLSVGAVLESMRLNRYRRGMFSISTCQRGACSVLEDVLSPHLASLMPPEPVTQGDIKINNVWIVRRVNSRGGNWV